MTGTMREDDARTRETRVWDEIQLLDRKSLGACVHRLPEPSDDSLTVCPCQRDERIGRRHSPSVTQEKRPDAGDTDTSAGDSKAGSRDLNAQKGHPRVRYFDESRLGRGRPYRSSRPGGGARAKARGLREGRRSRRRVRGDAPRGDPRRAARTMTTTAIARSKCRGGRARAARGAERARRRARGCARAPRATSATGEGGRARARAMGVAERASEGGRGEQRSGKAKKSRARRSPRAKTTRRSANRRRIRERIG